MAHIHLSWELGGGLGHAGRLKMLAQALLQRGHQVSMSLRDLVHTHSVLADLDVPKFQAPLWQMKAVGLPPTQGNLAEILFLCGYLDPVALGGLALGWRALLRQLQPDLLVADYAPTAILAARSMGLRSASIGNGFYSPPPGRPLPPLRDWEAIPPARLLASEQHMLRTANAVLAALAAPAGSEAGGSAEGGAEPGPAPAPFRFGADLLLGDLPLLCTWPELDHYERPAAQAAHWFGPNFLPQAGAAPHWPAGDGPRVFAYLKAAHAEHGALLQALVEQGCRVLCYLPEVAGGAAPPVSSPLLHYASAPVSLELALREAQLCVCHAGEGTLAQALLAGVPLLMLPMQAEQFLAARRVARTGAGYNAALLQQPDWPALVRRVLDGPAYRKAAQAFAARHQGFSQQRLNQELVALLERQL